MSMSRAERAAFRFYRGLLNPRTAPLKWTGQFLLRLQGRTGTKVTASYRARSDATHVCKSVADPKRERAYIAKLLGHKMTKPRIRNQGRGSSKELVSASYQQAEKYGQDTPGTAKNC